MEMQEILVEIGMDEEESKVYLGLLKLGSSLASKIADEVKLNRSFIYQLLDRLIRKGFVSYVLKENRRYYSSIEPQKLLDLLKEKEERLKLIMPDLTSFIKTEEKPVVEILEGKEGIKTILRDILRIKKDWLAIASGKATEILPYYADPWHKDRQKMKIKAFSLFNNSEVGRKRGADFEKMKFTEVRYMPEEYTRPSSTWIYGNRLVIVIWSKDHAFAIRIISKEIAEVYKSHFYNLWKLAKS